MVVAKLEEDVAIHTVLKEVLVLYDAAVLQNPVNLNLSLQFLPSTGFDEVRLWHNFYRVVLVGVERRTPVDLSKTTLPQELPAQVTVDGGASRAIRCLANLLNSDRILISRVFHPRR